MRLSVHLRIGYSHVRVGIVTIVFDRRAIAPRSSPGGGGCVSCCSIYAVLPLSTSEIIVGVAAISAAIVVVVVIFSWLYAIACLAYSLHDYLWGMACRHAGRQLDENLALGCWEKMLESSTFDFMTSFT